jgi:hypothetical protein
VAEYVGRAVVTEPDGDDIEVRAPLGTHLTPSDAWSPVTWRVVRVYFGCSLTQYSKIAFQRTVSPISGTGVRNMLRCSGRRLDEPFDVGLPVRLRCELPSGSRRMATERPTDWVDGLDRDRIESEPFVNGAARRSARDPNGEEDCSP